MNDVDKRDIGHQGPNQGVLQDLGVRRPDKLGHEESCPPPITGGVNCLLVDDATSTAPAFSGERPVFFISGSVNVPFVTVFTIDEPE